MYHVLNFITKHGLSTSATIILSYLFTIMTIKTSNPFSLYSLSSHTRVGSRLQDMVDYAESRFRAILTSICHEIDKDVDRKNWVKRLLHREVVSKVFVTIFIHINNI